MKFLLDFVGCCGVSSCRGGPKEGPESVGGLSEETHALVALRRNYRRRKRGRGPSAAGNNNSGVEWKPTLSAISENNVAAAVIGETGGGRLVKRKGWVGGVRDGGGRARDFVSLSSYVENYRRDRLGPKAEEIEKPVNPLVFLMRFILGTLAATYYVLVPIYMWLKDQIVPKGMPI